MQPLVSTEALALQLARPDIGERLRLFDATLHLRPAQPGPYVVESGRADHEAAHIPSAAFVDMAQELSDTGSPLRFTMPNADAPSGSSRSSRRAPALSPSRRRVAAGRTI